jgi:hypothetical protein
MCCHCLGSRCCCMLPQAPSAGGGGTARPQSMLQRPGTPHKANLHAHAGPLPTTAASRESSAIHSRAAARCWGGAADLRAAARARGGAASSRLGKAPPGCAGCGASAAASAAPPAPLRPMLGNACPQPKQRSQQLHLVCTGTADHLMGGSCLPEQPSEPTLLTAANSSIACLQKRGAGQQQAAQTVARRRTPTQRRTCVSSCVRSRMQQEGIRRTRASSDGPARWSVSGRSAPRSPASRDRRRSSPGRRRRRGAPPGRAHAVPPLRPRAAGPHCAASPSAHRAPTSRRCHATRTPTATSTATTTRLPQGALRQT